MPTTGGVRTLGRVLRLQVPRVHRDLDYLAGKHMHDLSQNLTSYGRRRLDQAASMEAARRAAVKKSLSLLSKVDEDLALEPLPADYDSTKRRKLAERDAFYRQPGRHKGPNPFALSDSEMYDIDYGEFGRESPHGQRNLARIKEGYRRSEQRHLKRTGKPYPKDTHALHQAMESQARADVGGKAPKKPKKIVQSSTVGRPAAVLNAENEQAMQNVYRQAQRNRQVRKSYEGAPMGDLVEIRKGLPSRLRAVMREQDAPKWMTDQQKARVTAHAAGRDVGLYRSKGKKEMADELVRIGRSQRAASRS